MDFTRKREDSVFRSQSAYTSLTLTSVTNILIKMFHDRQHFSLSFLKSQHPFQVQRVLNGFLAAFKWHFSDSGKQRRGKG